MRVLVVCGGCLQNRGTSAAEGRYWDKTSVQCQWYCKTITDNKVTATLSYDAVQKVKATSMYNTIHNTLLYVVVLYCTKSTGR